MILLPIKIASRFLKVLAIGLIGSIAFDSFVPRLQVSSAAEARFSITIRGRSVDPAHMTVRVTQGMTVELTFTADETVELHLHGYDRTLTVRPGEAAVMRLDAKIAGRFAIEGHRFGGGGSGGRARSHVVLLYLEVHPA
jgi:hypothetical protein